MKNTNVWWCQVPSKDEKYIAELLLWEKKTQLLSEKLVSQFKQVTGDDIHSVRFEHNIGPIAKMQLLEKRYNLPWEDGPKYIDFLDGKRLAQKPSCFFTVWKFSVEALKTLGYECFIPLAENNGGVLFEYAEYDEDENMLTQAAFFDKQEALDNLPFSYQEEEFDLHIYRFGNILRLDPDKLGETCPAEPT